LRSPGRPPAARRENYQLFWASIAAGRSSEDAAIDAGVSPAVGGRWFRRAGGMPPLHFSQSSKPLSGRYLSFAEREEIAILRVQGHGVCAIARKLGRAPRRSRASCAGMPRHVAGHWNIGPPPRNGMLIVRRAVPNRPSWWGIKRYTGTCRTGLQVRSLRLME
jgi:hypothetical protein